MIINPNLPPEGSKTQKVPPKSEPQPQSKVDFREVLLESNQGVAEKRKKQASGDLSSASSYEDFLSQMESQTKNRDLPKNKLDKDDFLKLFVTQLQQQDPLKPKDGTEMASQMAQFNSLEQMMNVNATLTRIEDGTKNQNQKNLVNYLDKKIAVSGGRSNVEQGKLSEHTLELPVPVLDASLEVRDKNDLLVSTQMLGPLPQGKQKLHWNGKNDAGQPLQDGSYRLSVVGKGSQDESIEGKVLTHEKVVAVDIKNDKKPLYTKVGSFGFDEITEIR